MRVLLTIGLSAIALYLGLLAALYLGQRRLLFPASSFRASAAEAGLAGFEDVVLKTADGERLVAWWRPPKPGRALLLYFHGNGGTLWNRRDRARVLTEDGRGLLMVSYRGYSGSTGTPTEDGLRQDAEAAYGFLKSYEPSRIVLYGESLGTGVAVRLATDHPVGGLVLDAPYTSTAAIAAPLFPIFPVTFLMRDQFRSIDRIARLRAPVLMLHGEEDGVIPIALSEILFAAAREPKRYVRLPGVDHVSVLERGGLAAIRAFLDEVEATGSEPP